MPAKPRSSPRSITRSIPRPDPVGPRPRTGNNVANNASTSTATRSDPPATPSKATPSARRKLAFARRQEEARPRAIPTARIYSARTFRPVVATERGVERR